MPTPRCRKLRYRDVVTPAEVEIKETTSDEAPIAFMICAYGWTDWHSPDVRYYEGKFYSQRKYRNKADESAPLPMDELPLYINGRYAHWLNKSFEEALNYYEDCASQYLIIDGVIYERVGEPRYVVQTFGLGHNHGGTALLVDTIYNGNISYRNYFSALDADKAIACANDVAAGRGDTNDVGRFEKMIDVLMPEVVSVDPASQHGDGDEFMNELEAICSGADSAFEAGLLAIMHTASQANTKR